MEEISYAPLVCRMAAKFALRVTPTNVLNAILGFTITPPQKIASNVELSLPWKAALSV